MVSFVSSGIRIVALMKLELFDPGGDKDNNSHHGIKYKMYLKLFEHSISNCRYI